jgi:hypothetical protein
MALGQKRLIGDLFLEWLASNLNRHPCRHLRTVRIAKSHPNCSARHGALRMRPLSTHARRRSIDGCAREPTAMKLAARESGSARSCPTAAFAEQQP